MTKFHNFFTVKFRKDLWRKLELNLSNLLPHYLAISKRSTKQLHIRISKNNKLYVRRRLFDEFLFAYLFFFRH